MPLRDYLVRRIEERPNDSSLWFHLAFGADAERIGEVVRLAQRVWDLEALGSGPALDLFGPVGEVGPHQAADFVLQELPRFPRGGRVLLAALESPVIHRLIALRALSGWPRELLAPHVLARVKARLDDPDETVRAFAGAVLRNEPLPESDFGEDENEIP